MPNILNILVQTTTLFVFEKFKIYSKITCDNEPDYTGMGAKKKKGKNRLFLQ